MHLNSFKHLILLMEIVYSVWHEISTYYSSVFDDLKYYVSTEHKLHSHYILW